MKLKVDVSMERKKRAPQKMVDVIAQLMARKGYGQSLDNEEYLAAWSNVAGPLAKLSIPGHLRRGVLDVFVTNSAALQELTFRKHQLLSELKTSLPQKNIRDLKFKIGSID